MSTHVFLSVISVSNKYTAPVIARTAARSNRYGMDCFALFAVTTFYGNYSFGQKEEVLCKK